MKKTFLYLICGLLGAMSACDNMSKQTEADKNEASEATADTAVAFENENEPDSAADGSIVDIDASGDADWNNIDMNLPDVDWPEFKGSDVKVRGNDKYSVYVLEESILFDTDKAEIRKGAEDNLKKVSTSIAQRNKDGQIRIYGYTDAQGGAGYNKELAQKRAEAVKDWLQKNGNIAAARITVHSVGEAKPAASNETSKGRQLNRRVEIVVRNS
ncbi:OmpA family protein [Pontibacter sp. Tf4]|uniref:OmpA family protein n=1 Tax=Pontibacter sp. Tf4 TaxID=2761620 RepID=UPI001629E903|nr:OmpA family protein [Pontibacter sp. Tf4]MBB6609663.1 OmpA family protein [Pontibacter sp. Tf4]